MWCFPTVGPGIGQGVGDDKCVDGLVDDVGVDIEDKNDVDEK